MHDSVQGVGIALPILFKVTSPLPADKLIELAGGGGGDVQFLIEIAAESWIHDDIIDLPCRISAGSLSRGAHLEDIGYSLVEEIAGEMTDDRYSPGSVILEVSARVVVDD